MPDDKPESPSEVPESMPSTDAPLPGYRVAPPGVESEPVAPVRLRFVPAGVKVRDLVLTLGSCVLLALIMAFHNPAGVMNPRGDDPAHRLGHYATLLHSGHIPGGVILGALLTVAATIGLLGLLGDSPLDLRGDEARSDPVLDRPFMKREGAWLVGLCALLYLPLAGSYGLWDPWETHYAEVAREILARDDWITLWWGQEGWFMSKPILIFWMSALGMGAGSTFGLPFWRDMGPAWHEWCIRVPICLFAIFAVYMIYRVVREAFGRRAGLFSGLVLATMPHWFFLSHQAMTDMPFVAPLVVSISFLILACIIDPAKLVTPRAVTWFGRTFRVSFWHLAVGAIILVALPQVLYLLTRPVMLSCPEDADRSCRAALEASRLFGGHVQFPIEQYWSGSASNSVYHDVNATVPGSPAWEDRYNQVPFAPSFVQGIVWLFLGGLILFLSLRRERSQQALSFSMMYLFGAISFMGKGPAGLGVPEIVLLGFMLTARKWHLAWRVGVLQGFGIYLLCGFPWYIAIYCRLGDEFFDRFVVHDLLNRAFAGVHGDTGTFRYFVWQLGYAMFPWTGLVPTALVGWKLLLGENATEKQRDVLRLSLLWFVVAFTLFSLMITKFHHYIFPAVPSVALMVGVLIYRMVGNRSLGQDLGRVLSSCAALVVGTAIEVIGWAEIFGRWSGSVPRDPAPTPTAFLGNRPLGVVFIVLGLGLIALAWMRARQTEVVEDDVRRIPVDEPGALPSDAEPTGVVVRDLRRFLQAGYGVAAVGAVVLVALLARDIGTVPNTRPAGYERFIHLFVYNYDRPFPTHSYDYTAVLRGFGIVAVMAALAMVVQPLRRHGVRTMVALATCFAVWGLDKYMIDLSHHWSQRTLFDRYYAVRGTRDSLGVGEDARYWADPMVAYQMNWKGENFYTGNHAAMLECGLPLCRDHTPDWLGRHRGQRVFFVTEHSRSGSVLSQVRTAGGTGRNISDEFDNNKFVLIEAQL